MSLKNLLFAFILALSAEFVWQQPVADATSFSERPEVQQFVAEMANKHGFDMESLNNLFARITPRPGVTKIMTGQVAKPPSWTRYRSNFVNPWRISHGVDFWNENAEALMRARRIYGVPEEVIVAILGVETRYGSYPLPYAVLDTLATLAFDYPRRGEFFRGELEQFLLLMREEGRDPLSVRGSFAGAMGIPQFMPSSYRSYAVDFDGDGHRDLWDDTADAIGSVANYLKTYGWEADQPIAVRAYLQPDAASDLLAGTLKPGYSIAQLEARGVKPDASLAPTTQAALLAVDVEDGREYWLGMNNFYVITRYNRNQFYALAVFQLSNEIRLAHTASPN
ncbi:MAG: lytic murein transglycosylase B [Sulfuricella sp.]|jgi:membrane-bound lytic murein transglycosylase B|nr:lytic murein transglycosylase B [Sulfuricella sp.]